MKIYARLHSSSFKFVALRHWKSVGNRVSYLASFRVSVSHLKSFWSPLLARNVFLSLLVLRLLREETISGREINYFKVLLSFSDDYFFPSSRVS